MHLLQPSIGEDDAVGVKEAEPARLVRTRRIEIGGELEASVRDEAAGMGDSSQELLIAVRQPAPETLKDDQQLVRNPCRMAPVGIKEVAERCHVVRAAHQVRDADLCGLRAQAYFRRR